MKEYIYIRDEPRSQQFTSASLMAGRGANRVGGLTDLKRKRLGIQAAEESGIYMTCCLRKEALLTGVPEAHVG